MRVVVITGPPGAGKSAVALRLHDQLADAGIANALVEADQLRLAHPPLDRERVRAHIQMLARSYSAAATDVLLVTETLETDDDTRALLSVFDSADVVLVRLDCRAQTAAARVAAREPEAWPGRASLIAHAAVLAEQMRSLADVDLVLSTEERDRDEVAAAIRDRIVGTA